MKQPKDFQVKALQLVVHIQKQIINGVLAETRNKAQYSREKPEELLQAIDTISDPRKWQKSGWMPDKEDILLLETLEYLLDDSMETIKRY